MNEDDLPHSINDPITRVMHFSEVQKDKNLLHKLWKLTNPQEMDGMRLAIKEYLAGINPDVFAIIAQSKHGDVLGWANLDLDEDTLGEYYNINVYVDSLYRGQGIGKILVSEAQKFAENTPIRAYPQDTIGNKLFQKTKFKLIKSVRI